MRVNEKEGRKEALTAQGGGDDMADGVEEEEFGDDEGLDEHGEAGNDDGKEADNVHGADDVKDDVTWTCQRFLEERHLECLGFAERVVCSEDFPFVLDILDAQQRIRR